jgi:Ni,Fe-hydrogenase III small subunit
MFEFLKLASKGVVTEPVENIESSEIEIIGEEIKELVRKHFGGSLAIREVDTGSCNACEYELCALSNPIYDISRFGIKFVASPKHADALLVTGPLTRNMKIPLERAFSNVPEPKFVITCGDCSKDGGIYKGSYAVFNGVRKAVPVFVHIPGCPPEPLSIMKGILKALKGIDGGN